MLTLLQFKAIVSFPITALLCKTSLSCSPVEDAIRLPWSLLHRTARADASLCFSGNSLLKGLSFQMEVVKE